MFSHVSLKYLIDDFNRRGARPTGYLLTLSRYEIGFEKGGFNRICGDCGWDAKIDDENERNSLLNDDVVFRALGFDRFDSMDYSEYEGATIVHDLNSTDIPVELINKYDYILDGGTIEHIFSFPNVMENIFKMLKIGGTFFFEQPAFFGFNHGYYNFSPCLFYEYFKANNYQINNIIPFSMIDGIAYSVDPIINDICGSLPKIENSNFNQLWGSVTKTPKTTFDVIPYQGLYESKWESSSKIVYDTFKTLEAAPIYLYGTGGYARRLLKTLPDKHRDKIAGVIDRASEMIGRKFYGYRIHTLEEAAEKPCVILIAASEEFQDIIYDRIKHIEKEGVKIVRLYER